MIANIRTVSLAVMELSALNTFLTKVDSPLSEAAQVGRVLLMVDNGLKMKKKPYNSLNIELVTFSKSV